MEAPPLERPQLASVTELDRQAEPVGHSLDDILRKTLDEPEWAVRDVLAFGAITSVGGYMGDGKTPLVLRLLKAIKDGDKTFLNFEVVAGRDTPVAYLTQEAIYTFGPAAKAAGFENAQGFAVYHWHENFHMDWPQMIAAVAESLGPRGILIVDVVLDWSRAQDENDAATMTRAFEPLVAAAGLGLAVVAVVHTQKTFTSVPDGDADIQHIRGSGAVVANSTVVLLYKKPREAALRRDTRYLKFGRSRFGVPNRSGIYVRLDEDTGELSVREDIDVAVRKEADARMSILAAVRELRREGERATLDAIRERTGLQRNISNRLTKELAQAGRLKQNGTGRRGAPYNYEVADDAGIDT